MLLKVEGIWQLKQQISFQRFVGSVDFGSQVPALKERPTSGFGTKHTNASQHFTLAR